MRAVWIALFAVAVSGIAVKAEAGTATLPASSARPNPQVIPFKPFGLACSVAGTPVEFPDDIRIINNGPGTAPKGTKVKWVVSNGTWSGTYVLPKALAANSSEFLAGVLGGGAEAGTPCKATVLP